MRFSRAPAAGAETRLFVTIQSPMHRYRSHTCGQLRPADVGSSVRLSGWVHRVRDHGGLLFIDLRDHYGITQVVVDPDSPAFGAASTLRSEWVVKVDGAVRMRPAETANAQLPTGEVELPDWPDFSDFFERIREVVWLLVIYLLTLVPAAFFFYMADCDFLAFFTGASTESCHGPILAGIALGVPLATLHTSRTGSSTVSANTFARATSRTWTKSRSCPPSSNTRGASPRSIALRKMLATPAYGVSRGIRGPYTLW